MRVLVYPHDLGMGGSQLNAIELGAAVRDLGHDVVVFGREGVLCDRVRELGLEFHESPPPGRRPSLRVARHLRRLARRLDVDVIHGYEWPPALEAHLASLPGGTVAVTTVMSMSVAPFIPHLTPIVVGTEQIAEVERRRGRERVTVIEPPVDVQFNSVGDPGVAEAFRRRHGIPSDARCVVCVTRLARELKLEGLLVAIDEVPRLGRDVVLVVVGAGPAADVVAAAAHRSNARSGREAVVLTGEVADPRPAYATADVVLGMGGSALRALAFGKPLVVQGERGFWRRLDADSAATFEWTGWYGLGDDPRSGADALRRELGLLVEEPRLRARLGSFGRQLVVERYSLTAAARRQVEVYETARAFPWRGRAVVRDGSGSTARLARHKLGRLRARLAGSAPADDFNARPVARAARPHPLRRPV